MNTFTQIYSLARYEWRRALARRMVLAILVLTMLVEFLPILVLTLVPPVALRFGNLISYTWLLGALLPQTFLIHFLALLIGAGSMADEYQNGTADIILSKPLSRLQYIFGKFLGGFSLLAAIAAVLVVFGIASSSLAFGNQLQLTDAPLVLGTIVVSSLIFYCIGFMSGELFRSTNLSYLAASSAFIVIVIIENVLEAVAQFQPNPDFYYLLGRLLPTWAAVNLPFLAAEQLFPSVLATRVGQVIFTPSASGSIMEALGYVALYAIGAFLIAMTRFLYTDITKRGT